MKTLYFAAVLSLTCLLGFGRSAHAARQRGRFCDFRANRAVRNCLATTKWRATVDAHTGIASAATRMARCLWTLKELLPGNQS